jgi:hypothetical protein
VITPPRSESSKRAAELRLKLENQIDDAIRGAQASNKWPAVAQVPAECHPREIKKPVLDACRARGWRVVHGMGTDEVEIYLPVVNDHG